MVICLVNVCLGYSVVCIMLMVKMLFVGVLWVMLECGLVMCFDCCFDVDVLVVFFGRVGVFVWNLELFVGVQVIVKQIDIMICKDEYFVDILVWDVNGK